MWVPNSILIGGQNDVFMPVVSFADLDQYYMYIQNRWGDVIFSSTSVGYGWDGMHLGAIAPEGTYGYFISIRDGAGRIYETTGLVHLLVGE
jgi:gliding motility-associated-like protein